MNIVLLAAGSSRRMRGRDKLLETIGGVALLRRQVLEALAADVGPVAVTLPVDNPARAMALEDLPIIQLPVPDAASGMSSGLIVAADWAAGADLMVCPADMPEITAQDFQTMAAAFIGSPLRAKDVDAVPGHPVVFPAALLPLFATLTGDEGARAILRQHPPSLIDLPDHHATIDLDTPEAWKAWRAANLWA